MFPGTSYLVLGHVCANPGVTLGELSESYKVGVSDLMSYCEKHPRLVLEAPEGVIDLQRISAFDAALVNVYHEDFPEGLSEKTRTFRSILSDAVTRSLKGKPLMEVVRQKRSENPNWFAGHTGRTTAAQSKYLETLRFGTPKFGLLSRGFDSMLPVAQGNTPKSDWKVLYFGPEEDGVHWVYRIKKQSKASMGSRGYVQIRTSEWHLVQKGLLPSDDHFGWLLWT